MVFSYLVRRAKKGSEISRRAENRAYLLLEIDRHLSISESDTAIDEVDPVDERGLVRLVLCLRLVVAITNDEQETIQEALSQCYIDLVTPETK